MQHMCGQNMQVNCIYFHIMYVRSVSHVTSSEISLKLSHGTHQNFWAISSKLLNVYSGIDWLKVIIS